MSKVTPPILIFLLWLLTSFQLSSQSPAVDSLKTLVQHAVKQKDLRAEATALFRLARQQAESGNAIEAQHNAQRAIQLFEKLGDETAVFQTYIPLIIVHQQMHNGEKIIEIAENGIRHAREAKDTALLINMLTALGIGYDETKRHAEAARCYLDCIALEEATGQSTSISHSNVSDSYSNLGNHEAALRHARLSWQQAVADGDTSYMAAARINEALALLQSRREDEALQAIAHSEQLALPLADSSLSREIARLKMLAYAGKGNFEAAYRFHRQYFSLDSLLSSAERNAHFAELEAVYETKRKEVENAQLSASLQRKNFWIFGIAGASLLLGTIAFLLRKRLKTSAQLLETEKALAEAERLRAEEEKQFYQRELADYTQLLIEKNQAIENLQTDLSKAAPAETGFSEMENLQSELTQLTILTDADWRNFRQKFERVHAGFFDKFNLAVPDATEAERRLAALTKLDMTNTEIATMLGISPESVTKTRYRLKKKMEVGDLEELVRRM